MVKGKDKKGVDQVPISLKEEREGSEMEKSGVERKREEGEMNF